MRHLTWVILTFVVTAFLVVIVTGSAVSTGFVYIGQPDIRLLGGMISISSLTSVIAGIVTFIVLIRNQKVMVFTDEVVGELARVTWPTRDETVRASVTVVFTTIFTASLLAAYD